MFSEGSEVKNALAALKKNEADAAQTLVDVYGGTKFSAKVYSARWICMKITRVDFCSH